MKVRRPSSAVSTSSMGRKVSPTPSTHVRMDAWVPGSSHTSTVNVTAPPWGAAPYGSLYREPLLL